MHHGQTRCARRWEGVREERDAGYEGESSSLTSARQARDFFVEQEPKHDWWEISFGINYSKNVENTVARTLYLSSKSLSFKVGSPYCVHRIQSTAARIFFFFSPTPAPCRHNTSSPSRPISHVYILRSISGLNRYGILPRGHSKTTKPPLNCLLTLPRSRTTGLTHIRPDQVIEILSCAC